MEKILRGGPREERAGVGGMCPVSRRRTHVMGWMHYIWCMMHFILCNLYDALGNLYDALYILHCALGMMHWALYILHWINYIEACRDRASACQISFDIGNGVDRHLLWCQTV